MKIPKAINNAIAIKMAALEEVSAHIRPGAYEPWGEVKCGCGELFGIYGSVHFSKRNTERQYASDLEDYLKGEDVRGQGHREVYDLHFLDVVVDYKTEL